jgi:hypothetical protein
MTDSGADLSPGSRVPEDARARDLLLRRVPEVAFLSEFAGLRFEGLSKRDGQPAKQIAHLADATYLERLKTALACLRKRADAEANGGLGFVAASLLHFVGRLPPERHPLVVALYFVSLAEGDPVQERPDKVAIRMDEYEEGLGPL